MSPIEFVTTFGAATLLGIPVTCLTWWMFIVDTDENEGWVVVVYVLWVVSFVVGVGMAPTLTVPGMSP